MTTLERTLERTLSLLGPPKQRALIDEILLWALGVALVAGAALWWWWVSKSQGGALWWDMQVYRAAGEAMAHGQDPYDDTIIARISGTTMSFVTPPAPAALIRRIAHSPLQPLFGPAILLGCIAGFFYTLVALHRYFFGALKMNWLLTTFGATLMAYNCAGVGALLGANIGTILHACIIAALIRGLTTGKWLAFHLCVVAATAVKPFYPLYWIVPVLARGWSWRQVAQATIGLAACVAIYAAGAALDPREEAAWLRNLASVNFGALHFNGDGAFAAASLAASGAAPYVIQLLIIAGVAALLWLRPLADEKIRIAALIYAAIMLNPRVNHYDEAVAVVPMLVIVMSLLPRAFTDIEKLGIAAALTISLGMLHDSASPIFAWTLTALFLGPLLLATFMQPTEKRSAPTVAAI